MPSFRPWHTSPVPTAWLEGTAALKLIIIGAIVIRLAAAVAFGDTVTDLPGVADQISYDALARQVLAGEGFRFDRPWWPMTAAGEPTAHWSYLYTLYLTGLYGLFGGHALAARVIQAVLAGALCPWLAWRLGGRLFGPRVGLASAAIVAGYGYFIYYAGALMTESFYILAILWMLDRATGMAQAPLSPGPGPKGRLRTATHFAGPWLTLGLALGTAALLRQVVLLFVPVLFAWLVWTMTRQAPARDWQQAPRSLRSVIGGLLVTMAVMGIMILPWTLRNYLAFDRVVLLNTNAGFAFFWGNHPIHGTNFVAIFPSSVYSSLVPQELRGLNEAALDQALLKEGLRFVADDPGRYVLLSASRVKDYFKFWPSEDSGPMSNLVRVFSFGVCLPFMLYGLAIAALRGRTVLATGAQPGVVLLYLFVATYSLAHLLSWALIRYRLPVDAVLLLFAALALVHLWERVFGKRTAMQRSTVAVGRQTTMST
jgi:4-amino-4-deoxy-L-arabinose transferase-like glycosyltransferase